jgi:hypothetical protein
MATYNNQILVYVDGRVQKISAADDLTMGGTLKVGGNLQVAGSLVVGGSGVDLMVGDKFLDINATNVSSSASAVGFTFNIKKASGKSTMTAVAYRSKAMSSGQARIYVSGNVTSEFVSGALIQVSGANKIENNGLFSVQNTEYSGGNTVLYLETSVPGYAPFIKDDVTFSDPQYDTVTGTVVQIDLGVLAMSDGSYIKDSMGTSITLGKMVSAFYATAKLSDFNGTTNGTGYTEIGTGGSSVYSIMAGSTAGSILAHDPFFEGLLRPAEQGSSTNALKELVGIATISGPSVGDTSGWTGAGFDLAFTATVPGTLGSSLYFGATSGNYQSSFLQTDQVGNNFIFNFVTDGNGTPLIDLYDQIAQSGGELPFFVSATGPSFASISPVTGIGLTATIGNADGEWFVFTNDLTGSVNNNDWIALRNIESDIPYYDINKGWQVKGITTEGFYLGGSTGSGPIDHYNGGYVYDTITSFFVPSGFTGGSGDSYTAGAVVTTSGVATDVFFGASGTAGSTIGTPIYLSSTPGNASITPPETGRVWRIGTAETRSQSDTRSVLFRPVFVTDL